MHFSLKTQLGQGLTQWFFLMLLSVFCQCIVLLSLMLQLFCCQMNLFLALTKEGDILVFTIALRSMWFCLIKHYSSQWERDCAGWTCSCSSISPPYWCSDFDCLNKSPILPQTLLYLTLEGPVVCPAVVHWSSGLW